MYAMTIPYMNLDQIYESYGMLNWHKVDDGKYIVINGDKIVKVEQRRENILFSCNEEDFNKIWYNYFDINTDYLKLHFLYRNLGEQFKIYCNRGKGVRILRRNLFEVMVLAIARHYIKDERFTSLLVYGTFCDVCGKKRKNSMNTSGVFEWREFPKPEDILKKRETLLRMVEYHELMQDIIALCDDILEGWLDLVLLSEMRMDAAIEYLGDYEWCKDDVMRYICLYGLHDLMTFDITREVRKQIRNDFGKRYEKWLEWYLAGETRYINKLGYLCQVIKYNVAVPITDSNYDYTQE